MKEQVEKIRREADGAAIKGVAMPADYEIRTLLSYISQLEKQVEELKYAKHCHRNQIFSIRNETIEECKTAVQETRCGCFGILQKLKEGE